MASSLVRCHVGRTSFRVHRILSRSYATRETKQVVGSDIPKPRLDYRSLSENVVFKSHNAFNRRAALPPGAVQTIAKLYEERKVVASELDRKRFARSSIGERIRASAQDPEAKKAALEEAKTMKESITQLEGRLDDLDERLYTLALAVPNDTHPDTPIGPESSAVTIAQHGPSFPVSPERDHVRIGRALKLLDLDAGATTTGSSWYYLMNEGALLELALTNYALSIALKHGFTFTTTPDVVRADIAYRCGFQPRDRETVSQIYHVSNSVTSEAEPSSPPLVLAGTAEIPLAGLFANKVFERSELPIKMVGLGKAFRAEAGARGADTRGLYRVHQFTKLELFVVSAPEESDSMMEQIRTIQEEIFQGLGLTFRVLDMPTEELGASAYRKYDMEAWMPGRGGWGEISSTSNCTDYQARRLHIRFRTDQGPSSAPLPFAHTLNGTAAAVPRLIVSLLENGACFDDAGNVVGLDLPKALQPFWVGGNGRNIVRWV